MSNFSVYDDIVHFGMTSVHRLKDNIYVNKQFESLLGFVK